MTLSSASSLSRVSPGTRLLLRPRHNNTLVSAANALFSWYLNILYDIPRPLISWGNEANSLRVSTSESPLAGLLWQAINPNARDFRGETNGEAWSATVIGGPEDSEFVSQIDVPPQGWSAYYVELIYPPKDHGFCQSYSTQVYVTPDVRPFDGLDPVLDPEDIAYPVNPPPVSAVDAATPGTFPSDLPLAEVNGTVASVTDSDILKYLPDEVAADIAEQCPQLPLVNLAALELKRRGEEAVDDLVDEAGDLSESVAKDCQDRSGFVGDVCQVADWF